MIGTGGRGVAFSPDGKVLAAADSQFFSSSSAVRLWDVDLESWLCRAGEVGLESWLCRAGEFANRNFTWAEWQSYFPDRPYSPTFPNFPVPPEFR